MENSFESFQAFDQEKQFQNVARKPAQSNFGRRLTTQSTIQESLCPENMTSELSLQNGKTNQKQSPLHVHLLYRNILQEKMHQNHGFTKEHEGVPVFLCMSLKTFATNDQTNHSRPCFLWPSVHPKFLVWHVSASICLWLR